MPSKILERRDWADWVRAAQPKRSSDAPPLRKKFEGAPLKALDVDPATGMTRFEFIASTEAIDREHDVILAGGWELDAFLANPVILFGHASRDLPIGRAVAAGVENGQLRVTVEFTPPEVYAFGYQAYKLVAAGFLRAVSVGFRPLEWVYNDEHGGYDFKRQELLEVSLVTVPANPEALMAAGLGTDPSAYEPAELPPDTIKDWVHGDPIDPPETPTQLTTGGDATPTVGSLPPGALYCHVEGSTANAVWNAITTGGSGSATTWTDSAGNTYEGSPSPELLRQWGAEPYRYTIVYQPTNTNDLEPKEDPMEELLRSLLQAVEALPDKIANAVAAKIATTPAVKDAAEPQPPITDTDPGDPELTRDELRALVADALKDAKTSITGRLPD